MRTTRKNTFQWALLTGVLFFTRLILAQDAPVRLIFAETVSDYKGQVNTTKAIGNVQFEYQNSKLFCDSAIFLRTPNLIYAYGHVQVNQGDTVNLFCDSLFYNGNTNMSELRGHVRLRDNEYKLLTDSMDYNGNLSMGYYQAGAVITSINEDLKLTSRKGSYFSNSKTFFFRDSVHVTHPEYELFSDTLEFRTNSATAHFHGPTKILSDSSEIHCNRGIYYTRTNYIQLWNGASMLQRGRTLEADSLIYDQEKDEGQGFCHVRMYDSVEQVLFLADYFYKSPFDTVIQLLDNAHVIQFSKQDTLFLSADTITYYTDTLSDMSKSIATGRVEIIRAEFMVACDSAYFNETDSIIKLHKNPVIWSDMTQLSGDSVLATYYNQEFHLLKIYEHAFIATEQDSVHYDQIKGQYMTAYLDSGKISKVFIDLNAQTRYYLAETSKDSLGSEIKTLTGMNEIDCNDIMIHFKNSEISKVSFNVQPAGSYTPIEEIPDNDLFLKGFVWQIHRKPVRVFIE